MSESTYNETRSANHAAAMQRRDDVIAWGDVEDKIRDCEEAVALLLKYTENSSKMDELFQALEEARGIAGGQKLNNE
jgi:hypothetical protein